MPLTAMQVKNAKATEKAKKISDGRGLYLLLTLRGSKLWRFDYRFDGKRKTLALGCYPDVSLSEARYQHEEARRLLAQGQDPSTVKQQAKQAQRAAVADTFGAVFEEWFAKDKDKWVAATQNYKRRRMDADVLPWLAHRPLAEIRAPELLAVLRRIEDRGALEMTKRVLNLLGEVFRYGIQTGRIEVDPSRALGGAIKTRRVRHMAALTDPAEVAALLRATAAYRGSFPVQIGLRLAPLLFVRPGELRAARWEDVDLTKALWSFTASKTGYAHIVPLAHQAIALFHELLPLTGHGELVFPSARSNARPMSENTLRAALIACGYDGTRHTVHGFRATARTLLDEELGFAPHLIEHQLGHRVKDALGRAYNRTKHLPARREMMQRWADYLEDLRDA